jgi:hypothetical protein
MAEGAPDPGDLPYEQRALPPYRVSLAAPSDADRAADGSPMCPFALLVLTASALTVAAMTPPKSEAARPAARRALRRQGPSGEHELLDGSPSRACGVPHRGLDYVGSDNCLPDDGAPSRFAGCTAAGFRCRSERLIHSQRYPVRCVSGRKVVRFYFLLRRPRASVLRLPTMLPNLVAIWWNTCARGCASTGSVSLPAASSSRHGERRPFITVALTVGRPHSQAAGVPVHYRLHYLTRSRSPTR